MLNLMSWRAFAAVAAVLCLAATPASAVHDLGLFELDGNAVEPNAAGDLPGDDWETLFGGGGSATLYSGVG